MSDAGALNVVATAAQLLNDAQLEAVQRECGLGASAAAALATAHHVPDQPIDFLRRALRRSHSSVVRLVAKLTDDGWFRRSRGTDGRAVTLQLAPAGRRMLGRTLAARRDAVATHLEALEPAEQKELTRLLGKLLTAAVTGEARALEVCRMCDVDACVQCPVETALEPSGV